ncbi:anticodon nuclease [Aquirufa ecclesiirivi]|uniref:hypothetical protein n=1 Tax=Aquirufa ecclesiirivi TaxID=2715124 RepID=UPI0022A83E42|nr:hypothetical protein [Aquirufa ecclesiirivi]MCZ2473238.1 anticodon nuclease [Aquirufa ecclesiirivi]
MGQSLIQIADILKGAGKKVQLIYAFNGSGKTRLSREFKKLIAPKAPDPEQQAEDIKILYYNAFTEDLFYWDNDLDADSDRKLKIQPNNFTNWVLREQGQDRNIVENFQLLTNDKLTPQFNEEFTEVRFSFERGNEGDKEFVKISKGEESCFIWSVFFSLMEQVVSVLNIAEKENRETDQYDKLEYIFIDDPVSSLDDNHLIELAVKVAELIKFSHYEDLKFIITTHNPLFYNVLYSELSLIEGNILSKNEDGTFDLIPKKGDSNMSFSYHLFIKQTIQKAIDNKAIQKYHFTLLRNLYEKTANFLGYPRWAELLPDDKQTYYKRVIQFTSHSLLSNETVAEPTDPEKATVKVLLDHLTINYNYWKAQQNEHI